jgi:hypothetical protein
VLRDEVFHRAGKARLPIEPLYGPNLAREAARGETSDIFKTVAAEALRWRLVHEIGRLLPKGASVIASGGDGGEG